MMSTEAVQENGGYPVGLTIIILLAEVSSLLTSRFNYNQLCHVKLCDITVFKLSLDDTVPKKETTDFGKFYFLKHLQS